MRSNGIPVVFGAPRSLRALNVVAVAGALAACTAAALMHIFHESGWAWSIVAGVPTFFVAWLWTVCLRVEKRSWLGVRWGWLASVPLAALNGALACGLSMFAEHASDAPPLRFLFGALLGATFGVVIWGPALLAVLLLFGVPIARAQKLAKLGLAGEERGERFVAATSAVLAAAALVVADGTSHPGAYDPLGPALHALAAPVFHLFALASIACGVAASVQATVREARRRRFIARVEAMEEPEFRVEPTPLGKVLLRVAPVANYRVADRQEELFELDEAGRATHRAG